MASKQISTSKYKAQWSPSAHKCFLDLCVEETSKGNRPGPTFNKDGWRNILESLNKRLGFNIQETTEESLGFHAFKMEGMVEVDMY